MIALNHAITGAAIGLISGNVWVAIPAAFISHFVCDAIPHFGSDEADDSYLRSKFFKIFLASDASACVLLVALLGATHPANWLLASVSAFVATLPDFAWLPGYIRANKGMAFTSGTNKLLQFASNIQWFEKPIGGVVEIAWLITGAIVVGQYL